MLHPQWVLPEKAKPFGDSDSLLLHARPYIQAIPTMFYDDYGTRGKDPQKVEAGRAGGKSRAKKLTAAERSASARKAIIERWRRYREERERTR
jgi:hypothetical protein